MVRPGPQRLPWQRLSPQRLPWQWLSPRTSLAAAQPSKTSLAAAQPSDFPGSGSALKGFPGSSSALKDCHGISLCITEAECCRLRAIVTPPGCHPRQDEVLLWASGGCQSGTAGGRYRSRSLVSHTHAHGHTHHFQFMLMMTRSGPPTHFMPGSGSCVPLWTRFICSHSLPLLASTHSSLHLKQHWVGVGGGGWWWGQQCPHPNSHTSMHRFSYTHIYKNNSEGDTDAQCCNVSPTRQERRRASAPLGTPVVELKSVTPRGTRQRHSRPACLRNQVKPVPRPASFSSRAAQTQCKESVFPFIAAQQLVGLRGQNCPGSGFNSIVSVSAVDNRAVFSRGSLSISSDSNDTSDNVLPAQRRPLTITGSG